MRSKSSQTLVQHKPIGRRRLQTATAAARRRRAARARQRAYRHASSNTKLECYTTRSRFYDLQTKSCNQREFDFFLLIEIFCLQVEILFFSLAFSSVQTIYERQMRRSNSYARSPRVRVLLKGVLPNASSDERPPKMSVIVMQPSVKSCALVSLVPPPPPPLRRLSSPGRCHPPISSRSRRRRRRCRTPLLQPPPFNKQRRHHKTTPHSPQFSAASSMMLRKSSTRISAARALTRAPPPPPHQRAPPLKSCATSSLLPLNRCCQTASRSTAVSGGSKCTRAFMRSSKKCEKC